MKQIPAVAVVGSKNTGKTTLVCRLVAMFREQGLRVGTIKHDGAHELRLDAEGTDSWQHGQAGAIATVAVSRSGTAAQYFYEAEPALDHWLEHLSAPSLGLDLILVEGYKHSLLPKLVLLGDQKIEQLSNVIGFVRNGTSGSIAEDGAGVYDREDIAALVRLIRSRVLAET